MIHVKKIKIKKFKAIEDLEKARMKWMIPTWLKELEILEGIGMVKQFITSCSPQNTDPTVEFKTSNDYGVYMPESLLLSNLKD